MGVQRSASLDTLPIEILAAVLTHVGDVERAGHAREVAPLALIAKRYVRVGRKRMLASVSLRSRRALRAFVAMLDIMPEADRAVGRLHVSATHEARQRVWDALGMYAELAHPRTQPLGNSVDEKQEFAELLEMAGRRLGCGVGEFELDIAPAQLRCVMDVARSLRAMTAGKIVRLHIDGRVAPHRQQDYVIEAHTFVVGLFSEAVSLSWQAPGSPNRAADLDVATAWPNLEVLAGEWDVTGMLIAIANQAPRLRRLIIGAARDVEALGSTTMRFAGQVRTLSVALAAMRVAFDSKHLVHFTALERLTIEQLHTFDGRHLPPTLVELRVGEMCMPPDDFATALAMATQANGLHQIVIDRARDGWARNRVPDAVKTVCDPRSIRVQGPLRVLRPPSGRKGFDTYRGDSDDDDLP